MPYTEDLALFTAEFGLDAVLDGVPQRVIFDELSASPMGMATREPRASLPTAALGASGHNSTLVLTPPEGGAARTYRVADLDHDGTGWTVLRLELQP